jgi:hypothetical protein
MSWDYTPPPAEPVTVLAGNSADRLNRHCLRCGYEWQIVETKLTDRKRMRPKQCPRCHSPAWDCERKNKRRPRPKNSKG